MKSQTRVLQFSLVMALHDEGSNIPLVVEELRAVFGDLVDYELILVDDGSQDNTLKEIETLAEACDEINFEVHPARLGKSAALITGIQHAKSDCIVTMDGDGQNDPRDALQMWYHYRQAKTEYKQLMVAGHRTCRADTLTKRVSSYVANELRHLLLDDKTRDSACGLKVFPRDLFLTLPRFNNMHRFLPALFLQAGGEIRTHEVRDRPRLHGRSKYGISNRLWTGLLDLAGVYWLKHRRLPPGTSKFTGIVGQLDDAGQHIYQQLTRNQPQT